MIKHVTSEGFDMWIDTETGTCGASDNLYLLDSTEVPEDFVEWSDTQRINWVMERVTSHE